MSTVAIPESLEPLVQYLNGLNSRVPIDQLREHLLNLDVTIDDLQPYLHFGDTCYRRNPVCQGEWYELLCICWRDGQKSLIHNHANSTCGLRVIEGQAIELKFAETAEGRARVVDQCDLEYGQVCCTQDRDIHQVCNVQGNGKCLVTLHIYSPPLADMQTWDEDGSCNSCNHSY